MSEGNGTADMSVDLKRELGQRANVVENEMARAVGAMHTAAIHFARHVHEYIDDRLWEVAGHDSLAEGLAQPGIRVSEKHAKNLALVYKSLVIDRKVPVEELLGVDLRTVQWGLPAITAGDAHWQDVVGDARALSRSDMAEKYSGKRKPNAPLNAAAEPELVRCETCQSWVPKERLDEHSEAA